MRVWLKPLRRRACGGQTMVEFALVIPLFLLVLLASITFAVIGQAALAVSQLTYNGARYAAVNPQLSAGQVCTYIKSGSLGSPTITGSGGANLTCSCTPATGFGQPVTVILSYDLTSNALVSNMSAVFSALGLSGMLPATLGATESAMSE